MPGSKRIGAIIRDARLKAGMSQTELARRLGVGQSTVSMVELGERGLGTDLIDALKHILHLDLILIGDITP